jgi:hypothetical protein
MNNKLLNKKITKYYVICIFFFIGFFILNIDQESILFASTLKNFELYSHDKSFLNIVKNADFTLQIYLPLVILSSKLGLNEEILNMFFSGITTSISMLAIYTLTKKISQDSYTSFIIPILLLSHNFINTREYGIHYPTDFFYFGQMGMYLFIISTISFSYKKQEIGLNIAILNFFCHAAWGLLNFFFIFLFLIMSKNKKKIIYKSNLLLVFFLGIISILGLYILKSNQLVFDLNQSSLITGYGSDLKLINNNFDYIETTHKLKIFDENLLDKNNWLNFFRFIFFDTIFFVTVFLWWNRFDKSIKKFLIIISIIIIFIYFLLIFYNFFYNILNYFSPIFSGIFNRIIINRYLNVINVITLVLHLIIFFNGMCSGKKNIYHILFIGLLLIINLFFFQKKIGIFPPYSEYIDIYNIFIWSIVPINILKKNFYKKNFLKTEIPIQKKYLILLISIFLVNYSLKMNSNLKLTEIEKKTLSNISDQNNYILLGGMVYGLNNFLHHLKNPKIIMMNPQIGYYHNRIISILFCNEGKIFKEPRSYHEDINASCFAKKKRSDWVILKEKLNINYIIMPKKNPLKELPIHSYIKNFIIYEIK